MSEVGHMGAFHDAWRKKEKNTDSGATVQCVACERTKDLDTLVRAMTSSAPDVGRYIVKFCYSAGNGHAVISTIR